MTREERKQLTKEIKKANQRLRALEKNGLINKSNVYNWIMRNKYKDIFSRTRKKEIKFRTDITGLEKDDLLEEFKETLNTFLESKTSTKVGIREVEKKRYKKFKENNEGSRYANMSFEEYQNFFDNKMTELMKKYGSDVIMAVLDTNPNATDDAINEWIDEALKNDYDYFQLITSFDRAISRHENNNFNNDEFNKKFDKWRNDSRFD